MLGQGQAYFRDISTGRKTSAVQRNSLPLLACGSARLPTAMQTFICCIFLTPGYMDLTLSAWTCSSLKSATSFDRRNRRLGRESPVPSAHPVGYAYDVLFTMCSARIRTPRSLDARGQQRKRRRPHHAITLCLGPVLIV